MMGVGQAVEVLVGQELGRTTPRGRRARVWSGLVVALGGTLAVALAYVFVPTLLVLPFRTLGDPAGWAGVEERVPLLLRFVAVYCLFDCTNMTFAFALRGAGDTRFVTATTAVLSWTVMVVPSYLAYRFDLGLYWAWGAASLYLILLSMIFLRRFLRAWKEMRVIGPAEGEESAADANPSCPPTLSDAINRG